MKKHLKFLLGLALIVFVFSGCQNPSGSETPEVKEPPVVEIPEDNSNKTKVEFRWCTKRVTSNTNEIEVLFEYYIPRYLLNLYFDSELNDYVFGFPEDYSLNSYLELYYNENFKKFSDDAFEKVFGTKYYEEGTVIDLKKWTYAATESLDKIDAVRLYFLTEDFDGTNISNIKENDFDEIVVGNEDIIVYVLGELTDSVHNKWWLE